MRRPVFVTAFGVHGKHRKHPARIRSTKNIQQAAAGIVQHLDEHLRRTRGRLLYVCRQAVKYLQDVRLVGWLCGFDRSGRGLMVDRTWR
jgi:hypothetical protein